MILKRRGYRLPRQHRTRNLKSTNLLERLNEEIKPIPRDDRSRRESAGGTVPKLLCCLTNEHAGECA